MRVTPHDLLPRQHATSKPAPPRVLGIRTPEQGASQTHLVANYPNQRCSGGTSRTFVFLSLCPQCYRGW